MRYAIKFGYDGRGFHGSQRQPDLRTVEGEILKALEEIKALDPQGSGVQLAGRTDRGVSALGNVLTLETDMVPRELMAAVNAKTSSIWMHSCAKVPDSFNPRHARSRWYRYLLQSSGLDVELFKEAASAFVGEHDFRGFCRPDQRDTNRAIESISVRELDDDFLMVDVTAQSFLWNMVRRMVSAMDGIGRGLHTLEDLMGVLGLEKELDMGLVDPHGLVLMDTTYDLDFKRDEQVIATIRNDILGRLLTTRRDSIFLEFLDNYCLTNERESL